MIKQCKYCNKEYESKNSKSLYCSKSCTLKAFRQKNLNNKFTNWKQDKDLSNLSNIEIYKLYFNDKNNLQGVYNSEKHITLFIPELLIELNNFINKYSIFNNFKFQQKLYHYINNITDIVKCKTCGINKVTFYNFKQGYSDYCSQKCGSNNLIVKEKHANTNIKKYGSKSVLQNELIKVKSKETIKEKYGVDEILQSSEIRQKSKETIKEKYGVDEIMQSKEIQEKAKQTNFKKYGVEWQIMSDVTKEKTKSTIKEKYKVDHISQSEEIINKTKQTNFKKYGTEWQISSVSTSNKSKETILKRYGVNYIMQSDLIKNKFKETLYKNNLIKLQEKHKNIPIISIDNNGILIHCDKCNTDFYIDSALLNLRIRNKNTLCINCNPRGSFFDKEYQITSFLESINIESFKDRKILSPLELDFYLKEYNLAIEFNGIYTHNEITLKLRTDSFKNNINNINEKNYHLYKTIECNKKQIDLIHIWEDEWDYKQDIVKSRLMNLLNKTPNKIYARKCIIKEITNNEAKLFNEINHLQGHINAKYNIGLYYNNELVSLMSFGKPRYNTIYKYELYRFSNKLYTNVIGGATKLFNYFVKTYNPESIITYANRDWTNNIDNNLYTKLNFKFNTYTDINYYWSNNHTRLSRISTQKHKLIKQGFDSDKTENEIMYERGFVKIYNTGNIVYIWKNNNLNDKKMV